MVRKILKPALQGDWPGFGTQLRYEAPGDVWVEIAKKQ